VHDIKKVFKSLIDKGHGINDIEENSDENEILKELKENHNMRSRNKYLKIR
jgi:hypothetical protein